VVVIDAAAQGAGSGKLRRMMRVRGKSDNTEKTTDCRRSQGAHKRFPGVHCLCCWDFRSKKSRHYVTRQREMSQILVGGKNELVDPEITKYLRDNSTDVIEWLTKLGVRVPP